MRERDGTERERERQRDRETEHARTQRPVRDSLGLYKVILIRNHRQYCSGSPYHQSFILLHDP